MLADFAPQPARPGYPSAAVADERQVVGNRDRFDAKLRDHACLVANDVLATIELDDSGPSYALREVFVGCANEHPIDRRVFLGGEGGGRQGIIGLELNHRPNDDPKSGECLFEKRKLGPEIRLDAFPGFVVRPELIAKRLDHLIGGDTKMSGAFLDHAKDGGDYTANCRDFLAGAIAHRGQRVIVPKKLVGSINQVNFQIRGPAIPGEPLLPRD